MQALEPIRRSITTAEDLQSVVRTMKGVAAANVRQFERAVASLADYGRTVELGLQTLLAGRPQRLAAAQPQEARRLGAVVFGSDQGLCGRFNVQVAEHAAGVLRGPEVAALDRTVLVVGGRAVPALEAEGLAGVETVAPATSLAGIPALVRDLLGHILRWRSTGGVDRILLFHNEATGGASYRPRTAQLFPVDLEWLRDLQGRRWPTRRLPMITLPWPDLFRALVREHFYLSLFRAAAESLASENASRLASMQAAERNIDERLEGLNQSYRLSRQHAITAELLEIISGFEALSGAGP